MRRRTIYWWLAAINFMLACGIFYAATAHAGDDHHNGGDVNVGGDTVNVGGDTITGGDVTVGGHSSSSKALGLGRSSFDVDIRDCRESVAFDTILFGKQNVRLNPWCAAERYDQKGLHRMAAIMRCDIAEVREHFASTDECVEANTVTVVEPMVEPVVIVSETDERDNELIEQQQQQIVMLSERLEKIESRANRPRPQPQVVQQYGLTDAQRAEIAAVLEKGKDQ